MNRIVEDNSLITKYYIQYGITDGSVTNNDGLLSNFVVNFRGMSTTGYTATKISELLQSIKNSAYNNDQYHESFYDGQRNGYQWYLDFSSNGYISEPLYWPMSLTNNQINGKR